jgi:pimeloyl-ACP methyl ester carboxylesterase
LLRDPGYYGQGVRRGTGEPVLLIPGFFAGDWMMAAMARWLARIGYRPYLSGIDWNVGCPDRKVELLGWRTQAIARESGVPLVLVGHSLGGMLARAIAVRFPERVRHLVMLGTPSRTESWAAIRPEWRPALRAAQSLWSVLGASPRQCGTPQCECAFALQLAPLPDSVGLSSIYTRSDEIIDWRTCIDPRAENHEVPGGHLSLHINRHVYRLLAEILVGGRTTREADGAGVLGTKTPALGNPSPPNCTEADTQPPKENPRRRSDVGQPSLSSPKSSTRD